MEDKTVEILSKNGVILHLTDTTWGLAASCHSEIAINKIYDIKNRPSHKSLLLLVSSVAMLEQYVAVDEKVIPYLYDNKRPTTIIYNETKGIPEHLLAGDKSIAIRVVKKKKLAQLIDTLGHPLVSTSANISGDTSPVYYQDINPRIIKMVDLAVPEKVEKIIPPSRIISFKDGEINVLRD